MKLACVRCKRKKIKCDKGEPVCHQCITAKTECQYVERRQRPKLAQQRVAVHNLSSRLEMLEKQLSRATTTASGSSVSASFTPTDADPYSDEAAYSDPIPSPKVNLETVGGQDSWVYQMASDVRRNIQSQSTPVNTPTPRIDHAMSLLNEALEDLGTLRVRMDACKVPIDISMDEKRACIEAFIRQTQNMVVPDFFAIPIELHLLRSLPDIIESPYVNIDPGMRIMYYNALYFGIVEIRGSGDPVAHAIYLKVLECVPAWLDDPNETDLDGFTAGLLSWTTVTNYDYQLSWKFHCKSCQFIKMRKIDQIDVIPARTLDEDNERDKLRYLYWQVLSTDMLFRLFYGKPTVVRWSSLKVKPPTVFGPYNMQPSAIRTTVLVFWVRYVHMTGEILNTIDGYDGTICHNIDKAVDRFCHGLEALIGEWKVESLLYDENVDEEIRILMADQIMTVYATIIGVKRITRSSQRSKVVDPLVLHAARKVTQITLDFTVGPSSTPSVPSDATQPVSAHFISFFPFCAVFTLYEHILASTDPDDCEQDMQNLEKIGAAILETTQLRIELLPFARTITALNKVSKSMQDERRRLRNPESGSCDPTNASMTDLDASTFASFSDFPISFDEGLQPMGFVRALENDVLTRNWNEAWWDMNTGLDHTMTGIPGHMDPPVADYGNLPTPNTT